MSAPIDLSQVLTSDDTTPFDTLFNFEAEGMAHPVLVKGEGPAVILMHEMPGFVPQFWRLANWIVEAGFTVYAPALYENPETPLEDILKVRGPLGGFVRACISRQIHLFAANDSSPVTVWLRALARDSFDKSGGRGVGVIGLCLSGNFAWSLCVEPSVLVSVAAEPSLPFHKSGSLALSDEEKRALKERDDLTLVALRFDGDPACRAARFEALNAVAGSDRVRQTVLPDSAQNPDGNPFPHAVLTKDLINKQGEPTLEAARQVLSHLRDRL